MADTTISLTSVGLDGSGNAGELAFFDTATSVMGASGITVINVAGASTLGFGTTPGTLGAVNIDASSYGTIGYSLVNATLIGAWEASTSILRFGTRTAHTVSLKQNNEDKWFLVTAAGVSALQAAQVTARIVGGSTNGLAIRNSANNRDNIQFPDAGGVLSTQPKVGVGYTVGAGGTVTQLTSKATAFTLDTVTGQITFNNSALVAFAASSATWTCSAMASADVVIFNHVSGGTVGEYTFNVACSAGSGVLTIRNIGSGSLSEAPVVNYAIIKGAQS